MDNNGNDTYISFDSNIINTSEDIFNINSENIGFLYTTPTIEISHSTNDNSNITLPLENVTSLITPQFQPTSTSSCSYTTSGIMSSTPSILTCLTTSSENLSQAARCAVSTEPFVPQTNDKFKGMIELLTEWGVDELKHRFITCGITLESLPYLKCHHIQTLFNKEEYLGLQVKFEHFLEDWKNQNKNQQESNKENITVENESSNGSSMISSITETYFRTTLDDILDCYDGKAIKSYYEHHNSLNDHSKELLLNLIVNTLISKQIKLSTKIANDISDSICLAFPNEIKEYYYIQQKNSAPKGRLYNLYQRRTYNLRKSGLQEPLKKINPQRESKHYDSEHDAEETRIWLLHHREPWDDIRCAWYKCIQHRMLDLMNTDETNLSGIFKRWPLYKHSHGYDLIEIDFKFLHSNALNIFVEFENFGQKIFDIMKKKIKDKLSCCVIKDMINGDLSEDGRNAGICWLLNALIVPVSKLVTKDLHNKIQQKKFTIRDGQNSFILLITSVAETDNMLKARLSSGTPFQPIIIVVGEEIIKPIEFYVYVDGTKYKLFSFLSALDIAFKIYHVLHLRYPIESTSVWQFIQTAVYNISTPFDKTYAQHKILMKELNNE